jgi:hypothetical protein
MAPIVRQFHYLVIGDRVQLDVLNCCLLQGNVHFVGSLPDPFQGVMEVFSDFGAIEIDDFASQPKSFLKSEELLGEVTGFY